MNTFFRKKMGKRLFFMLICMLSVNLLFAQHKRVNIDAKNITLNEFLSEIRRQTGYDFVFKSSKLDFDKRISPKFKDATVVEVLNQYFNVNSGVIYILRNQTIVVIDEEKADYVALQGQVINSTTKQPMFGVTVGIGEKNIVTKTDKSGNFLLNVPEYAKDLHFIYVGFDKKIVPITASVKYQVELEEKLEQIEDVVVTGIFNRNIENYTGAARTMSGEELKKISPNNIFAGIAAVEPSFQIVANNVNGGNINQVPDLQIRGANSMPNLSGELSQGSNLPLFILDGFEVNLQRIVDLDMNMIASVTILKDASATAIYGSRGANGIMVVNTIRPKSGKILVNVTNDSRVFAPNLSVYNYLNAAEKLDFEVRSGVYDTDFGQQIYRNQMIYNERLKNAQSGVDTDWKRIPVQYGYNNRTSVNLQGGDENIRYTLLASGDLQQGVMKGQDRKNYSGQFDLTYQIKKLQFQNSIRVYQNRSNESPFGNFSTYLRMNPYWSPYDDSGNAQYYLEDHLFMGQRYRTRNPVYDAELNTVNESEYLGITNNFQVRYSIMPNLFIESRISVTRQKGGSNQFYPAQHSLFELQADVARRGSYSARSTDMDSYESLTTLNYTLSRGKHQWVSTAAFNAGSSNDSYYTLIAEGFPFDRLDNLLFASQYEANGRPTGDEGSIRRLGYLYNGNYSYDNRFLADVSIKRDGSSQFGTDRRFGTFWSAGLGWNIHNEHFFEQNTLVNRLRLRSSYGSTGSLNIPAYSALTRYGFGVGSSYFNDPGALINNLGNPSLTWQEVTKFNVGLDVELFQQRLDFRLDWYQDMTKDAITQLTLAPSTGFETFPENLGKVQNNGFEYAARYKIIDRPDRGNVWSIFVNGFTNKNILKELSNRLKNSNEILNNNNVAQVVPNTLLEEGQSMDAIYVVRSLGVDPVTGSELFLNKDGEKTYTWNAADKVAVGNARPKWNGNFGTNLSYHGFELGAIFNYQFGGQLYNYTLISNVQDVNPRLNVDRRAYDLGWSQAGDVSQFTRIGLNTAATRLTSRFVQDNNMLTMSTLSMGYNFYNKPWLKRVGLRSFQVSAITNDLFQWSSIAIERGTSNPFYRSYALSIRLGI